MFPAVRIFDFMAGETVYKSRLSNSFHGELQYYLIPRTARGSATWVALRAVDRSSKLVGKFLKTLNLKERARRFLRRHA
jgi:CelD/BcsL family acetyltransferase involved in cellulose biosynthesis